MNVRIRPVEPDDYEALHQVVSGPHVQRGTLVLPWASVESSRKRLAELPDGMYWLAGCVDDQIVGSITLRLNPAARRRHVAELAIAVRDDYQGRGVGSALMQAVLNLADNWLNVVRIEMVTWVDNEAALALYKKFGFEIEGTHRCYAYCDGRFVDAYALARVRS